MISRESKKGFYINKDITKFLNYGVLCSILTRWLSQETFGSPVSRGLPDSVPSLNSPPTSSERSVVPTNIFPISRPVLFLPYRVHSLLNPLYTGVSTRFRSAPFRRLRPCLLNEENNTRYRGSVKRPDSS